MDFQSIQWPATWEPTKGATFESELAREAGPGHPLFKVKATSIAKSTCSDDVLFCIEEKQCPFAVVHLTWSGNQESLPYPLIELYNSLDKWLVKTQGAQILVNLLSDIEDNCIRRNQEVSKLDHDDFILECLSLIDHKLPRIAHEGFEVAKSVRSDKKGSDSLAEMRGKCWQYLKDNYPGQDRGHDEIDSLRAVIFALNDTYSFDNDFLDGTDLFLSYANRVEPHYFEQEALIRKCFGKYL